MLYHPHHVLKIVLRGSLIFVSLIFLLLCHSFFIAGNTYVLERILFSGLGVAYILLANFFYKKHLFTLASWMTIVLFTALAFSILFVWGINTPMGILLMGFVILLAGVLLGARLIMPIAAGVVGILIFLQVGANAGFIVPDFNHTSGSGFGDVASYTVIFFVFSLISWLSRNQMEQSLKRALSAEAKLEREKELLALRLEEQTKNLKESQLQEMQQLYRFAELGQLSTLLLHDLANHLSVLTLDMDDIEQRHKRSEAIMRAKDSIGHLDHMVSQVRQQLHESSQSLAFSPIKLVNETIDTLGSKASKHHVIITSQNTAAKHVRLVGDPLRFSQIIAILTTNAIESYRDKDAKANKVIISSNTTTNDSLIITIEDTGSGITKKQREQLFKPFQSTKSQGMGIGLFIAKNMIESHFKGTITLDPRTDKTLFQLTFPLNAK